MDKAKHTPGPWRLASSARVIMAAFGGGGRVATVKECPEAGANARLIAAAPALLAVVERLARNGECTCADLGGTGDVCDVCEARAALALARPQS